MPNISKRGFGTQNQNRIPYFDRRVIRGDAASDGTVKPLSREANYGIKTQVKYCFLHIYLI